MKEFWYECFQIQPEVAMLTTAIKWAMFRIIFGIDKNEEICVTWQNKSWTKIEITEDWDKIREQVVEQYSLEDNRNFLWRLVIKIRGQMGEGWKY